MPAHATEHVTPCVGAMTDEQAGKASLDALDVFEELGERIQWVQSYVTEDKAYCIYTAAGTLIRAHAEEPCRPLDRISKVRRMMMEPIHTTAGTA